MIRRPQLQNCTIERLAKVGRHILAGRCFHNEMLCRLNIYYLYFNF
jgi:hypothetical protein